MQQRLQEAVAERERKKAAKQNQRAEFNTTRNYGLQARHAAKLARNREREP